MKIPTVLVSLDIECTSCKGTGLYEGMAEGPRTAVICTTCKGTGKVHYERTFNVFIKKKRAKNVERVFQVAGDFSVYNEDIDGVNFTKAGVLYNDWFKHNKEPVPIYEIHCPLMHYYGSGKAETQIRNTLCREQRQNFRTVLSCCDVNREKCWKAFKKLWEG